MDVVNAEDGTTALHDASAGGYTTILHGRSMAGCHALQIEINRNLYLDEDSLQRRAAFDSVKTRITAALTKLTSIACTRRGGRPLAAE